MNIKKTLPVALSIISAIGTVATAVVVAKETTKIDKNDILELKDKKNIEKLKFLFNNYKKSLIIGGVTVASTVSSTILSKKAEASLIATAGMLDTGWRRYKDQIKKTLGINTHNDILTKLSKDDEKPEPKNEEAKEKLYYEEHAGYFYADPEKLAFAYADLNQRLHIEDYDNTYYYTTLYNLIEDAGAELQDKDKFDNLNFGWSDDYLDETYGCTWVHMHEKVVTEEGGKTYTVISFSEEPIFDPGNGGEIFLTKKKPEKRYFKLTNKEVNNNED